MYRACPTAPALECGGENFRIFPDKTEVLGCVRKGKVLAPRLSEMATL